MRNRVTTWQFAQLWQYLLTFRKLTAAANNWPEACNRATGAQPSPDLSLRNVNPQNIRIVVDQESVVRRLRPSVFSRRVTFGRNSVIAS